MAGYVDLHCHWVWEIDDGARSATEGVEMLSELSRLGFEHVVATPHMRPGMFDNTREHIRQRYEQAALDVRGAEGLPSVSLSAEHYFNPEVLVRLEQGEGLAYPGLAGFPTAPGRCSVLVEFSDLSPLQAIERALHRLRSQGLLPVIAHPERYRALWRDPTPLYRLLDLGCAALLDSCAIIGKYGAAPEKVAWRLLEAGAYSAACSDAHRPADVQLTARAMEELEARLGGEELEFLFAEGPRLLLSGELPPGR